MAVCTLAAQTQVSLLLKLVLSITWISLLFSIHKPAWVHWVAVDFVFLVTLSGSAVREKVGAVSLHQCSYVVQSIISWTGLVVVVLCTTADTLSHNMVPCSFFSCPSKQKLHACSVSERKRVTVVKGSCLRVVEIKNVAKFCQKWGKSASKTFQIIKQVYSKEAWDLSAV
jgi:hypothetical protein